MQSPVVDGQAVIADRAATVAESVDSQAPLIVYFSSVSENTHRFVQKLGLRAVRIPVIGGGDRGTSDAASIDEPYILICPTYGGGKPSQAGDGPVRAAGGFVPRQVVKFLNDEHNRSLIRGVIAAGNTNFGEEFCHAGDIISAKCRVPYLYRFELMGTADDVERVRDGLREFDTRAVTAHVASA